MLDLTRPRTYMLHVHVISLRKVWISSAPVVRAGCAHFPDTAHLINPPGLSPIACLVLAELHGRMGYFPPILRLRPIADTTPPAFEVAEIISLHAVREQARGRR